MVVDIGLLADSMVFGVSIHSWNVHRLRCRRRKRRHDDSEVAKHTGNNFKTGFFDSIEAAAVKRGIDAADLLEDSVRVTHGSTVTMNIMVEKSGADIALITTKGHEDTIDLTKGMGRIHSESLEHLLRIANVRKPEPTSRRQNFGLTDENLMAGMAIERPTSPRLDRRLRIWTGTSTTTSDCIGSTAKGVKPCSQ